MEQNKRYINYEYKKTVVSVDKEALYKDSYNHMGWEFEKSRRAVVKHVFGPIRVLIAPLAVIPGSPFAKMAVDHKSETEVELTFKRDRSLANRAEINRLQLQFENAADTIDKLEESKTTGAAVGGYLIGIIGTVFMACSVFSYLAGLLPSSIVLAVPGFLGWILSAFLYKAVKNSKTRKVEPLIEKQYDDIYDICSKASTLG